LALSLRQALAAPALAAGVPDLEFAHAVLVLDCEPVDDAPILDLRLRKGVRRNGMRLTIATGRPSTLDANAELSVRVAPGMGGALLAALDAALGGDGELEALAGAEWVIDERYRTKAEKLHAEWDAEVTKLYAADHTPPAQSAVIGAVNAAAGPRDVVVCAAGSMPGDLHKLWRTRDPKGYHVEYGYSCMGYEIPGGIGTRLAAPDRDVFVMLGDGSYLMSPGELTTAVSEEAKLIVVLVDNHGFASIGALSRSLGTNGFGTASDLPIDFVANARSLGARAVRATTIAELRVALSEAKAATETTVIVIETDPLVGVPSYESWWEVAPAEASEQEGVRKARQDWSTNKKRQRRHI